MSRAPITITIDDDLALVKQIFDDGRFHHLLVIDQGLLVGVISDRDLLRVLSPGLGTAVETRQDAAILHKKAHQIMSRGLITLSPEAGVYDAISLFNLHNISCIPIIDNTNKPVGIVSWRDIMRVLELKRMPNSKAGQTSTN